MDDTLVGQEPLPEIVKLNQEILAEPKTLTLAEEIKQLTDDLIDTFGGDQYQLQILQGAVMSLQAKYMAVAMKNTKKNFDVLFKPVIHNIRRNAKEMAERLG